MEKQLIREVVQPDEQADWDAQQRLDEACRALARLGDDFVDWTLPPASKAGKRVVAELCITDARRPLRQLAWFLYRIANEIERLPCHQRRRSESCPPSPEPCQ